MVQLTHTGFWSAGTLSPFSQITGLQAMAVDQRLFLVSTSGAYGELAAWEWTGTGLVLRDTQALSGTASLPAPGGLAVHESAGMGAFYSFGGAGQGLEAYRVTATGQIAALGPQGAGAVTLESVLEVETAHGTQVFGGAREVNGLIAWDWDGGAGGVFGGTVLPAAIPGSGTAVPDMAALRAGGQDYLLTLDPSGDRVSAFRLEAGGPVLTGTASPHDVLWVNTPVEIETATVAGRQYAVVGASDSNSLSVLTVTAAGQIGVTDHVIDDRATRFDGVTVVETVEMGDRAFVLAAGADDGISLMTLLPGGRLLGLDHLASAPGASLEDITALEAVVTQTGLTVFAAGEGLQAAVGPNGEVVGGVAAIRVELGPLNPVMQGTAGADTLTGDGGGDMILGGAGNDRIRGQGGGDILDGGAGADTLWGGTGSDIFVFTADGARDRIQDFELGVDRIDLSGMGFAYAIEALDIQSRSNGASITFNGETLDIVTRDGSRLSAEDFTLDMLFDMTHMPTAPLPPEPMRLQGTAGDDLLAGGAMDDTLRGEGGSDLLTGGGGADLLLAEEGRDGFDAAAARVVRLYQATLDRLPDAGGLKAWTTQLQAGAATAETAAAGLVASAEFRMRYGDTTNGQFVTLLYGNVLDRLPDAGGLTAWTHALDAGMSRAEVVLGFADSAEFRRDMMAETLDHSYAGLQAGWTDDVFRLFRATLDRSPAEAGLLDWAGRLAEGLSYTGAAAGIVNGAEFQARFGATTNAEFVTLLYGNVLDRAPEAGGLAAWTHALNAGMSRAEAVTRFASSAEFVRATKADLTVFMRGLGGDDTLRGGAGNDTLFGGALADSFVFDATESGVDHIVDLEPWDSVVVENAPWSTPAQLFDALRQVGEDVVLDMGAAQIVLDRTDLADLTPDMFILQ